MLALQHLRFYDTIISVVHSILRAIAWHRLAVGAPFIRN